MRVKPTQSQRGFTLVEVTIAMAIFATALTVITFSFVGLLRIQRNVSGDRATQRNARRLVEEITRDIRYSNGYCFSGNTLYIAAGSTGHAFYFESVPATAPSRVFRAPTVTSVSTDCSALPIVDKSKAVAFTSPDVASSFSVIPVPGIKMSADIRVSVALPGSALKTDLLAASTVRGIPTGSGEGIEGDGEFDEGEGEE